MSSLLLTTWLQSKELARCSGHKINRTYRLQNVMDNERNMGKGQESKTRSDSAVEVQERGEIFFFFRPKVGKEEAHDMDDVQRLYVVLRPESGDRAVEVKQEQSSGKEGAELGAHTDDEKPTRDITSEKNDKSQLSGGHGCEEIDIEKQPLLRFIVMGRKTLPDRSKKSDHRPHWGFVEMVTTKVSDVKAALKGKEYDTSTRGHRTVAPARAVGEGVYLILRHNPGEKKMHTHLVYKLEFPSSDEKNGPQEEMNIKREASFLIQIKNPENRGNSEFRGLQSKRKAVFPAHLQAEMGQLRYHPADPPDFLNYEGCEFLLISASDNIDQELGLEIKTEVEGETAHDVSCSDLITTFGETASITPLLKGTWA